MKTRIFFITLLVVSLIAVSPFVFGEVKNDGLQGCVAKKLESRCKEYYNADLSRNKGFENNAKACSQESAWAGCLQARGYVLRTWGLGVCLKPIVESYKECQPPKVSAGDNKVAVPEAITEPQGLVIAQSIKQSQTKTAKPEAVKATASAVALILNLKCPGGVGCCCGAQWGLNWGMCSKGLECRQWGEGVNRHNLCVKAGGVAPVYPGRNPSQPMFCRK